MNLEPDAGYPNRPSPPQLAHTMRPHASRLAVLLSAFALVGCASSAPPVAPQVAATAIQAAEAAVERAREVGAEQGAPTQFRAATSRLGQAQDALAAGERAQAARLAREAAVDGRLAEATVLAARARTRLALSAEVRALREAIDGAE